MTVFYVNRVDQYGEDVYIVSKTPRSAAMSEYCVGEFERLTGLKLKTGEGKWFKLTETAKPAKKASGKAKAKK